MKTSQPFALVVATTVWHCWWRAESFTTAGGAGLSSTRSRSRSHNSGSPTYIVGWKQDQKKTTTKTSISLTMMEWETLDFQTYSNHPGAVDDITTATATSGRPRMFKDEAYRDAVCKAWKEESERDKWSSTTDMVVETRSVIYEYTMATTGTATTATTTSTCTTTDDTSPALLYGHVVRRRKDVSMQQQQRKLLPEEETRLPGILFFHTGAGPHDIFLLWKAESMVRNSNLFPNGCIVLIADILSDEIGWAWDSNRSRYNQVRDKVFAFSNKEDKEKEEEEEEGGNKEPERPELQRRVLAAYDTLCSFPEVDSSRIAALGWCLGGYPIFELGRFSQKHIPGLRAMITFHGVFGSMEPYLAAAATKKRRRRSSSSSKKEEDRNDSIIETNNNNHNDDATNEMKPLIGGDKAAGCHILICNGVNDPFVKSFDLTACVEILQNEYGHHVQILPLQDAKHGFTNPAQDFNDNPAFEYHIPSATIAWLETLKLLKKIV